MAHKIGNYYFVRSFSVSGTGNKVSFEKKYFVKLVRIRTDKVNILFLTDTRSFSNSDTLKIKHEIYSDAHEVSKYANALSFAHDFKIVISVYLSGKNRISEFNTSIGYKKKIMAFVFAIDLNNPVSVTRTLATVVHELVHATEPHMGEMRSHSTLGSEILASTIQTCFLIDTMPDDGYMVINSQPSEMKEGKLRYSNDGAKQAADKFLHLLGAKKQYTLHMHDINQVDKLKHYCHVQVLDQIRHGDVD
jgi:hypothetical protein